MRVVLLPVFLFGLSSCDNRWEEAPRLDPLEANAAVTDARRYLGEGAQILAVCGASSGASVYLEQLQDGLGKDGIDRGLIVFALRPDGEPEILTRDVFREMIVTSEDGGQISRLNGREDRSLGLWVIQYPSTGVVVSHNLATAADGSLINLWTQNKPPVGPLPARTSVFHSKCETNT